MKEESKAIEASAKAAEKGLELGVQFLSWLSRVFGGPVNEIAGIIEDKLKFHRWKNGIQIFQKADEYLKEKGLGDDRRLIPLKLGVAILSSATLEEDEALQDMWARLIAEAVDPSSSVEIRAVYARILAELDPVDAKVLQTVYQAYIDYLEKVPELKGESPIMLAMPTPPIAQSLGLDDQTLRRSVDVLIRQRVLQTAVQKSAGYLMIGKGGPEPTTDMGYLMVSLTELGFQLMQICLPPN